VTEQGAAPERRPEQQEPRCRWSKVGSPDVGRRLRSGDQNRGGGCHWTGAALEQGRRPLLEQGPEQERAGRRVESRRWAAPFAVGEPRQAPEARNRANEQRLRADKVAEEPITKNRVLPKNRRLLTIQRSIGRKSP